MERARLANQLLSYGNELAEFLGLRLPPRYQSTISTEDLIQWSDSRNNPILQGREAFLLSIPEEEMQYPG